MRNFLSIVICTRNRPVSLQRTLRSVVQGAEACPRQDFEVLIVDNGAGLDSSALEAEFGNDIALRIIREERPGLSVARNTGVAGARGDWILWTDDDVSVDSRWLSSYRSAIARFPDANIMGGPVIPTFDGHPPAWLLAGLRYIRSAFAARHPDEIKEVFRTGDALPWGANFATRRSVALQVPFDTSLGRHPARPTGGGEETAVIRQILSAGGPGRWLRDAKVLHHIDRARQTEKYIRSYFFDIGSRLAVVPEQGVGRWQALRNLCAALYRAAGKEARYTMSRFVPGQPNLARHLRSAAINWGAARTWLDLTLGGKSRVYRNRQILNKSM